jgi:protein-S-isoprenylcysteine O-methyltransferase Ste14
MLPTRPAIGRPPAAALLFAWCGAAVFALSLLYFLYSYLVRFGVRLEHGPRTAPALVDAALFTVFALHHSILARPSLKARVRRAIHPPLERSLYTWVASLLFLLVCWLWQPVPGELYRLTGPAAIAGWTVQAAGLLLTARSSARLGVLELAGVTPVRAARAPGSRPLPEPAPLETRGLYGLVRHPLYFAWVLFVFAAPVMTMTRFVFAAVSTAYLALAIPFEERSLLQSFGPEYAAYRTRVRWRMLPGIY